MSTVRRSEPRLDAGHLLKALAHLSFNLAKILWTLIEKAWISEGLCRPTQLHSQIKNKTMATRVSTIWKILDSQKAVQKT